MSARRPVAAVRVRPMRALCFGISMTLTMLAVVAAVGLLPAPSVAFASPAVPAAGAAEAGPDTGSGLWVPVPPMAAPEVRLQAPQRVRVPVDDQTPPPVDGSTPGGATDRLDPTPPADSGSGRRIVLDLSAQQVWLVRERGSVLSTYLVSGSRSDNLHPGEYAVYSRSASATSFDYSSTMRWMVRFTEGDNAAIGFHSIPRDSDGRPIQSWRQLGTPTSHGCIRQRPRDARALWRFAPVGTPVVVVA